jgi:quaternary ammonium compound-resistance protein SugE
MELLFVTLISFCIGLGVRYALPGRDTYGVALTPSLSAVVTAIVWVGLTWLGWKFDGGWIWVVSLVAGSVISLVLALVVPRTRRGRDENLLQQLSRA